MRIGRFYGGRDRVPALEDRSEVGSSMGILDHSSELGQLLKIPGSMLTGKTIVLPVQLKVHEGGPVSDFAHFLFRPQVSGRPLLQFQLPLHLPDSMLTQEKAHKKRDEQGRSDHQRFA